MFPSYLDSSHVRRFTKRFGCSSAFGEIVSQLSVPPFVLVVITLSLTLNLIHAQIPVHQK